MIQLRSMPLTHYPSGSTRDFRPGPGERSSLCFRIVPRPHISHPIADDFPNRPGHDTTVVMLDGDLRVLSATGDALGADGPEVLGRTLAELIGATAALGLAPLVTRALAGEGESAEIALADGRIVGVRGAPCPIAPAACVLLARDLTRERGLEAKLREAHQLQTVGSLTQRMLHDFNNLLMGIMGCADLAQHFMPADGRARPFLAQLKEAALRGSALTRQVQAVGRRSLAPPALLQIEAVVGEAEPLLKTIVGDAVRLTVTPFEGRWAVRARAAELHQALVYLALNARDALPNGGAVTLALREVTVPHEPAPAGLHPGDYCVLAVEDDGPGMDAPVLARAVEPFFTTRGEARSGLGLTLVAEIAERAGGGVLATSTPGHGTRVSLFLPRAVPLPAPGPAEAGVQARRRLTVLVVDDESLLRLTLRSFLEQGGYRVIEAADAAAAAAVTDAVDVLLTDVTLPGSSGREVARSVTTAHAGVRVVFMSAHRRDALMRGGDIPPDSHFLEKPFSEERLAEVMAAVVATP